MDRVRAQTSLPLAVGFGIGTPQDVAALVPHCNAVVVGSALIRTIRECIDTGGDLEAEVGDYVASLAAALRK